MKYPNLELIEYITDNLAIENFDILDSTYCHRFRMYVFPQTWSSTALGFGGCGGQAITEAYTTVVEMSWSYLDKNDEIRGLNLKESEDKMYAVFFDGMLAYICMNPNEEFFKDLDDRCMKPQRNAKMYYGDCVENIDD